MDRSRWAKGWVLIAGLVMILRFALYPPDRGDAAENVLAVAVSTYGLFLIGGLVFRYGVLVGLVSVHPDDSVARKVLALVVGAAFYLAGLMAW